MASVRPNSGEYGGVDKTGGGWLRLFSYRERPAERSEGGVGAGRGRGFSAGESGAGFPAGESGAGFPAGEGGVSAGAVQGFRERDFPSGRGFPAGLLVVLP